MRYVHIVLEILGGWLLISVIAAPLIGRWLAQVDTVTFDFDLDAPPPNPAFAARVEADIFDWARAETDLADRSEP